MLTEIIHALVLQTHAVQHPLRRLCHSWIVVTFTRFQGSALHDDAANLFQIYKVLKLKTIAKRTRGGHHGVLHLQRPYIYF